MREVVAALAALMLVSCAPRMVWTHSTADRQQFAADKAECLAMAQGGQTQIQPVQGGITGSGRGGFGEGFIQGMNIAAATRAQERQEAIFQNCMLGKGYRQVRAGQQ